ncbi:MAG: hypothetical protein RLZZ450_5361 [Pseudomonadota bacterium]|jgi:hypothetical protein
MRSSARVWLGFLVASGSLWSCSFIDDFDKFHAAREADGQGDSGAGRNDAATPGGDARVVTDAADGSNTVVTDSGEPGVVDANVVVDGSVSVVDASNGGPGVCGDGNVCSDNDPCTVDGCDAAGATCTYRLIDADSDGFSPFVCRAGSGHMGGDCNDDNPMIAPTALEICDGIDNNCDSRREIDEGLVKLRCYPDLDGDGYPNLDGMGVLACQCPRTSIPVASPEDRSRHDCWDDPVTRGADVFPGQTDYFEDGYGPGGRPVRNYDYDCDGKVTPRLGPLPDACGGLLGLDCKAKVGYSKEVPTCGEGAEYTTCGMNGLNCSGMNETRKQSCR